MGKYQIDAGSWDALDRLLDQALALPPPEVLSEPQAAIEPSRARVVADTATLVRRRGDIPPPPSCFVVENRKFRAVART